MTNEEDEKAWKYEDEKNLQTSNSFKGISKDPNAPINLQTNCDKPSLADRLSYIYKDIDNCLPDKGGTRAKIKFKIEDAVKQTIKKIKEKIKKYIDYSSNMLDEDYLGIMSIIEEEMGKELYEEGK